MTFFVRLFLIVPPFLLLNFSTNAQLEGKIELLPDETTYQVSIIPSLDWSPPQSITNSAQITLRAATGSLDLINFQNITGTWTLGMPIIGPPEAQNFDYFSLTLNAPLTNLDYQTGVELVLFQFENAKSCTPVRLVDNTNDPFLPPNSLSVNIGNQFTVLAAGLGINAYAGNAQATSSCPQPDPLFMSAQSNDIMVNCPGDVTSILVNAIGGEAPYSVTWINNSNGEFGGGDIDQFEGSINFPGLPAGEYVISISDNNDLQVDTILIIEEPLPIAFDLDPSAASCQGADDGQITIRNLTGGTISGDYIYNWSASVNQSDSIVTGIGSGIFSVTITDDNGCTETASTEVESDWILEPVPDVAHVQCYGESNGVINLYSVGSNPTLNFNWGGNGYSGEESSAWGLSAGMYYYTITDATGVCNIQDSVEVQQPEEILVDYSLEFPSCERPNEAYMLVNKVINAREGYRFTFDETYYFDEHHFLLIPGDINTVFIEDGKGCKRMEEIDIPLYNVPQIVMEAPQIISLGEEVRLKPAIFPPENLVLKWSPSESLSCDDCPSPMAKPSQSTAYTLSATDSLGCRAKESTLINVKKDRKLYIPNAFSPNGDGENDYFNIYPGPGVSSIRTFQVFNRWGSMVYESADGYSGSFDTMGWDGTFNGQKMQEGVYIYSAMIEFTDGVTQNFAGEVTLLK